MGETAKEIFRIREELIKNELANLRAANAEKEEIYKKETELMALQAAEQRRIREEATEVVLRTKVETVNAITSAGIQEMEVGAITTAGLQITNHQKAQSDAEYRMAVIDNQMKLDAARRMGLDNLIAISGAESAVGRAALIAKQILAAKELFMEAKKTITFATLKASEATVATAAGAAKTAAIGFPQNIPFLIAYAVQAAGIIGAIVSAVRGAKKAAGGVGGDIPTPAAASIGGGRSSAPSMSSQPQAPVQEICPEPTIKAFVLAGDARNGLEAEAKLNNRRTLGG